MMRCDIGRVWVGFDPHQIGGKTFERFSINGGEIGRSRRELDNYAESMVGQGYGHGLGLSRSRNTCQELCIAMLMRCGRDTTKQWPWLLSTSGLLCCEQRASSSDRAAAPAAAPILVGGFPMMVCPERGAIEVFQEGHVLYAPMRLFVQLKYRSCLFYHMLGVRDQSWCLPHVGCLRPHTLGAGLTKLSPGSTNCSPEILRGLA